ncbi:MAG: outer membrane lipoprotein-sorting protein [Candidatus Cloacimonadales bacterium]|nr:outer membrane lipoprotein-sorting protein [Candidatus Cloacimonadales bacterium]
MKKIIQRSLFLLLISLFFASLWAEEIQLTAVQILGKADDVINAPQDQDLKIKLILIDKKGKEKVREMSMLQKGSDKRLVKFLSPADQKGIAFLSLPDDVMYLYMPAFKKIRRIASHVKNTKFAGTDFTYEDMEAVRYSDKYIPEFIEKKDNHFLLQLTPKEGIKTDYAKLIMWVREDNFYITKIEHYNRGDKLFKIMIRDKIEKIGEYWLARESEMQDLKSKHTTKMIIEEVKLDSEVSDDKFTKRNLEK